MYRTRSLLCLALLGIFGLSVLAASPVQAQETDAADDPSARTHEEDGSGFFAIGVNAPNLGPLNSRLSGEGYPTFPSTMLSVGGGGYGVVAGNLLLGGEGHSLIAPSREYKGREVTVGGGYGLLTVGYRFRPTKQLVVYPQVGIGGGGLSLNIGSKGGGQFDDVLGNPNREASLRKGSVLVSLGAGLEYRVRLPKKPGGFQIGLRAGYLLSAYSSDWSLGEDQLSGGPDASLSGPYVQLTLGGWGGDKNSED